ncbi:DUF1801 domain-containing protein [Chondromyces crocatus]|uniref:YdhG-like domain-containing protein n=1 Tax=Chondromyces crocatus TaxID=52 RepID=A0A0K1EPB8_CHOCO|nr:DUF1801 domain-containing protein [Chondromyces crocatus]AKT42502.1 uncharacterized protein CMC5_067280 [Chondromyces crocatus]
MATKSRREAATTTKQPSQGTKKPAAPRASPAAPRKRTSIPEPGGATVTAFLDQLDHPLKKEIHVVRQLILGVSPEIREEIKWNAPSFRTTEHFATFNLRTQDRVRLILHTGAKAKKPAQQKGRIEDPEGLLEWLAEDRCLVTLISSADIESKRAALEAILSAWIARMESP